MNFSQKILNTAFTEALRNGYDLTKLALKCIFVKIKIYI